MPDSGFALPPENSRHSAVEAAAGDDQALVLSKMRAVVELQQFQVLGLGPSVSVHADKDPKVCSAPEVGLSIDLALDHSEDSKSIERVCPARAASRRYWQPTMTEFVDERRGGWKPWPSACVVVAYSSDSNQARTDTNQSGGRGRRDLYEVPSDDELKIWTVKLSFLFRIAKRTSGPCLTARDRDEVN